MYTARKMLPHEQAAQEYGRFCVEHESGQVTESGLTRQQALQHAAELNKAVQQLTAQALAA